jgi:hypothetical protein
MLRGCGLGLDLGLDVGLDVLDGDGLDIRSHPLPKVAPLAESGGGGRPEPS